MSADSFGRWGTSSTSGWMGSSSRSRHSLKRSGPNTRNVPISVSTFARIRTVTQAEYFLKLGARTIILEEETEISASSVVSFVWGPRWKSWSTRAACPLARIEAII